MDILLAGGSGRLIDEIIDKFRKEGHRVFVLTGNRYRHASYNKVFEKYYFPYDSDVLGEIFESINPDVILFMGAYDTNFEWGSNGKKSAVNYLAGLANMLLAYYSLRKGRFIYLSSQEVFSDDYEQDITEDLKTTPDSTKAMAVAQGEQMCLSYNSSFGADTVVLRIEHLFNTPHNRKEIIDVCSSMCLEAVRTGQIVIRQNHKFSMIHQSDAVEFIFRIANAGHHNLPLYNIASSVEVSESSIAMMIKNKMGASVSLDMDEMAAAQRRVFSNKAYDAEFGIHIFHSIEDTISENIDLMSQKMAAFEPDGSGKRNIWLRFKEKSRATVRALIPFIENMVCFIPFFMLNNRAVGSDYFANLDFYLLYVLLFAIIYGQHQAVFSAVLAVAGYCFRQMYDRTGFDVMLDYNTYIWIAQLFILGLVVGYMRDQIRIIKGEDEQEMGYLSGLLGDIEDINDSNVRMKNVLETQIVNQNDSFGKLYEITSTLEQYSPEEVLFYAAEVLSKVINSKDVAIYTVANGSYARLFSATSAKARELGNSVNYTNLGPLYDSLVDRKVFINRKMDEKYPLMANAIYSEDEMQLIVMVWGIPWERMTLGQANMLTVISYLIQNAVVRANRYLEALEYKRYVEGTNILEADAFTSLVKAYMGAKSKGLTECTFLCINCRDSGIEQTGKILSKKLRQSDFLGQLQDGKLYALLANTNEQDAQLVMARFSESGYESEIKEELIV